MNPNTREEVFDLINEERDYQDATWNAKTTASEGKHSPEEWIMYIENYLTEAKQILSRKNVQVGYPQAMDIMRKVGAMAVKAMEQHKTPRRGVTA